ncbi:MAG: GNAT family N-acetyltransferase [Candidatus Thorarchaeota archaeon]|nr:GNAT family N-acetyltransferase [Candidatus Thorarchaeota archaeon]
MTDLNEIMKLETLAANAWPARETRKIGGWLLRADNGITRRANSVLPLGSPSVEVELAITDVINFYQKRNITPRFQMTPACGPPELDKILDEDGFSIGLSVHIQINSLSNIIATSMRHDVTIDFSPKDNWIAAYGRLGEYSGLSLEIRRGIMDRIPLQKGFASLSVNDEIVGVCLGVVENTWLGIFALIVDKKYRRHGIGADLNSGLAMWAESLGSTNAYLQVETRNKPAIAFYKSLGFKTLYNYWYRLLDGE